MIFFLSYDDIVDVCLEHTQNYLSGKFYILRRAYVISLPSYVHMNI